MEYNISPVEVKKWDAEEIFEALAYIRLMDEQRQKGGQK